MPAGDPYLTIKDIRSELRVSHETVRQWIVSGQLPYVKLGRQYRIRRSDLERMLAGNPPTDERDEANGRTSTPNPMSPGAGLDAGFSRSTTHG